MAPHPPSPGRHGWLLPGSSRRRRQLTMLVCLVTTVSTVFLWLYLLPSHRQAIVDQSQALVNKFKPPPPPPPPPRPRYTMFGLDGFDADVQVNLIDIHLNQTADAADVPIDQDLGVALQSFTNFKLDSATFTSPDVDKQRYILSNSKTQTVTAQIAPILPPPDASHITFGFSTSLNRIADTLGNLRHWAAGTNARFLVAVAPRNTTEHPGEPTIAEATQFFVAAGIPHVKFVQVQDGWINGYVSLIAHQHKNLEPQTKWVSWIDDDTFFLNPTTLLANLDNFNAEKPYYIGALSENWWNVQHGGIIAVGGAGVFLSRPLLEQLAPHAQKCYEHKFNEGGDGRLADCVYTWSSTKLTQMQGLYQLDLHGDVSGFYEGMRVQPVSVHHWKSWHRYDLPMIGGVRGVCGHACVLQHWRFGAAGGNGGKGWSDAGGMGGKGDWLITNGFSIIKYSDGYEFLDKEAAEREAGEKSGKGAKGGVKPHRVEYAMEHTWKKTIWDIEDSWKYSLEPLMDRDEGKIQFNMERMEEDKDGNLVVDYVRRVEDGLGKGLIRVRLLKA